MSDWRALDFSIESFGAELWALCRRVPLLDEVLCELDVLHDPRRDEDRALRNHHRDLALHGGFTLKLHDSGSVLRSGPSVILEEKQDFFGVQGRPDMILAGSRVGFGHPLTAVVLPRRQTVVRVRGPRWNVAAGDAERAVALFAAAGVDWAGPPRGKPLLVIGDENYAHMAWNQLGALWEILKRRGGAEVVATHQPLGDVADLFGDFPGLHVTAMPEGELPSIDPRVHLPFAPGGILVLPEVRRRVLQLATARATAPVREFCDRMQALGRRMVWITVRTREKTAVNLAAALAALATSLLESGKYAIVLDGFALPEDFARNQGYRNPLALSMLGREQVFVSGLLGMLPDTAHVFNAVGGGMLDSIYLASRSAAYFAHNGTLQHRAGYFTNVPGLVHASPGILAWDHAATLQDLIEDGGAVEYIAPDMVSDVVPPGGQPGRPENLYRFTDIPALVAAFWLFLERHGVI